MRIGLFTDQFSVGISGQTTSVMLLYNCFKQNGHTCYIFTSHTKKLVDENPDIINLPGMPYPIKGIKQYRFSPFIKRHIKRIEECKLDIIQVRLRAFRRGGSTLRQKESLTVLCLAVIMILLSNSIISGHF